MMASKKELKRKIKTLKKECKVAYDDYQSIGRESIDATILLNDIVKLLAEYDSNYDNDGNWFMRAFRVVDIERIEKLKKEVKELKRRDLDRPRLYHALLEKCMDLEEEVKQLKAPKITLIDGNGKVITEYAYSSNVSDYSMPEKEAE